MDPECLRAAIDDARAGKAAGFEALLDGYGRRLYGYFYRTTGNHHDAEDLLSEMSLRLVKRLKTYDDRGRFEPWLFRIAANLVRDRIRRSRARPATGSLSLESGDGEVRGDRLAGVNPGVDARLLAEEMSTDLKAALARLDDVSRQMVLLRHFGEMSFKEIAQEFDCPLGTALAKVHRAMKVLKTHLDRLQS